MNILFVGKFFPPKVEKTVLADTRGEAVFSDHNFEMSLLSGLAAQGTDVCVRAVTVPYVYSYPHNNRRAFIRREVYTDANGVPVYSAGFCNIVVINQFARRAAARRAILRELSKFEGDEVTVIVNTPVPELSGAVMDARRRTSKRLTTAVVVPDVRECLVDMSSDATSLKGRLVRRINRRNARLSAQYDRYIFLTAAMNDFYKADPGNVMVMEGLLDEKRVRQAVIDPDASLPPTSAKEIILYAGTLNRIFGVTDLVDMFEKAAFPNTELWICGNGDAEAYIRERADANPAIRFFGIVSPDWALRYQSRATILVNPRTAAGEYTRYSFPSKTIEYLLAGKTVVMNRLPGIPAEYDRYVRYPKDESAEAWADTLRAVMAEDPDTRAARDNAGRDFILSSKTARAQCARIVSFLSKQ